MVSLATVAAAFHLVNMLGLQVIGVKREPARGLRSEHLELDRNRIGRGQDVELQRAGYLREQDPDSARTRRQSLLQEKSRVLVDATAPAIEGSVQVEEADAGGGCQNGENCGRLDGFAGCCGGASGTSVTRTSVTTTTTLSATITGAHTPRTTTTTTTTTTVAAITSTTTPSPLDLDFCFVFDITNSMSAYLEELKQKSTSLANDIVNRVRKHMPDLPTEKMPRYAVVPYKDFEDHLSPSTILDFTGDLNKLSKHIQPLEVGGGGDTPEDILGGLHTATETLSWERAVRFLVVVTDAPGHGPDLNDEGLNDKEKPPPGVEAPPTVEVAMKDLQSKGINLVFVSCNAAATRKTENAMRDHYNNDEREMTSLALSGAEGWIGKLGDQVVNKLLGRDHM